MWRRPASTTVQVSSSKVVLAVFAPVHAEESQPEFLGGGGGGGGGGAVPTRIDLSAPLWSPSAGGKVRTEVVRVPVPVAVPVPEPAILVLLGLGAVALRGKLG